MSNNITKVIVQVFSNMMKLASDRLVYFIENQKTSKVSGLEEVVAKFLAVVFTICSLSRNELIVYDENDTPHRVEEYMVAKELVPFCTPRGVYISPELSAMDVKGDKVYRQAVVDGKVEEDMNVLDWRKSLKSGGPSNLGRLNQVPATPSEFKALQGKLYAAFRTKPQEFVSISEVSEPAMLSDIGVIIQGDKVMDMTNKMDTMPITITISDRIYDEYSFNIPIEVYLDEFIYKVVDKLK